MIWSSLRRLMLGPALIAAASAVLLVSDVDRRTVRAGSTVRLALLQHASTQLLDDTARGILDALADRGFSPGGRLEVQRFNAHGDMATGIAIARQVTSGEYDMVVTVSTPAMQAVANNNTDGRTTHIFAAVADPFSAGIGLNRENPADHPPYMTGQSSLLPVHQTFVLAREMYPGLKAIGVAWNPAESNSEMFTRKARESAAALGLTLLEATVDNSSAVSEAINSLIARGAQALWIGGDNTMMSAVDSVVATARRGGIPVFSITPGAPDRGTLFDVGLDFYGVGRLAGVLVADVLEGANPASIPVRDVLDEVPQLVSVNLRALEGLRDPWRVPDSLLRTADIVVSARGIERRAAANAGDR